MSSYTVRPVLDPETFTWSYIIVDKATKEALIIDPVLEHVDRDLKLMEEMGVKLTRVLETHIHADHITAASQIKDRMPEIEIVYGEGATNHVDGGDFFINDGEDIHLGQTTIKALKTPGHTPCSTCYVIDGAVFTGDTLFIRGCGRTDFMEGSSEDLFDNVREKLFTLPDDTIVYPCHDYKTMLCSTIGEEKEHNPRLKMRNTKEQFVQIMKDAANTDYPDKIDIAVPANKKAGRRVA